MKTLFLSFLLITLLPQGEPQSLKGVVTEVAFTNKAGKTDQSRKELYLKINDHLYFIKWCKSDVQEKAVRSLIGQSITISGTIAEGEWDICDDNDHQQSRVGEFLKIHKITSKH